jgi:RHS repeat-associated protein
LLGFGKSVGERVTNQIKGFDAIGYTYKYDQLNRITGMSSVLTTGATGWNSQITGVSKYFEKYVYDANGNIKNVIRNDDKGLPLDYLTYLYQTGTNQLFSVRDVVMPTAASNEDFEGREQYTYDAIGNLINSQKNDVDKENIAWNVYGKIKSVILANKSLTFAYDAQQNRLKKSVTEGGVTKNQFYIRDAQGNVLAVYDVQNNQARWKEQHLYGSSRLGVIEMSETYNALFGTFSVRQPITIRAGEKRYELSNHLGNVMAVVNDRKQWNVDRWDAVVLSAQDYYPFGMTMPGRSLNTEGYRFGFNGKENDNEIKGTGNQQDYGMRIYDPRLGRFLSVDPLTKSYPELTPYQFASNMPIAAIDIDGLESYITVKKKIDDNKSRITIYSFNDVNNSLVDMNLRNNNGKGDRVTQKNIYAFDINNNNVIQKEEEKDDFSIAEKAVQKYGLTSTSTKLNGIQVTNTAYASGSVSKESLNRNEITAYTRSSGGSLSDAKFSIPELSNQIDAKSDSELKTGDVVFRVRISFSRKQDSDKYLGVLTKKYTDKYPNAQIESEINPERLRTLHKKEDISNDKAGRPKIFSVTTGIINTKE